MAEMTIYKAIANLNKLLCANVEHLSDQELSRLVKKRYLQWHPDKNPENPNLYREQFQVLFESYEYYKAHKGGQCSGASETDSGHFSGDFDFSDFKNMYCDEEMFSSDDEEYNNTGFDDQFFTPSPTKDFKVPDTHRQWFRSKSNRRAGKFFAVYCKNTQENEIKALFSKYEFLSNFFAGFNMSTHHTIVLAVATLGEFRIVDIKKNLKMCKIHPSEVFYCVKFKDYVQFLKNHYGQPFFCGIDNIGQPKRASTNPFDHNLICEYALSHKIDNVLKLMVEYSHLASACTYSPSKISNDHIDDHNEHRENAYAFKHLSDRRRAAQNAVQSVVAELFVEISKEDPHKFIDRRSRELGEALLSVNNAQMFGEAWFYSHYHVKHFALMAKAILNSFIFGTPRMRWTVLQGDYKSGKTSFASAFTQYFEGVTININVDKNRLSFFLGNALGKRFVLFDDVKGRIDNKRKSLLTPGSGFQNLDDLRDHLDGHVKVQLEKKNQQPVEQKFPPGIITCNKYVIEPALLERVQGPFKFRESKYWTYHEMEVTMETIFIGCVLHNLLPVESYVHEHISLKVSEWQQQHAAMCDCLVSLFTFLKWALRLVYCWEQ